MSGTDSGTGTVEIDQPVYRRRWTSAQKLRMVEETMQQGNSVSRVARQHEVSPAQLYKWRRLMPEGGASAIAADEQVVSQSEVMALKKRIAEPERVLGKKTMENEVLKTAVELVRKKTDLARALVRCGRFPIGLIAGSLAVSHSKLYEHPGDLSANRSCYIKKD